MPVNDEIKEQQKKVKEMTLKGRLHYFWDYYRIHTIVTIIVVLFLISFIKDIIAGNREEVLNIAVINATVAMDTTTVTEDYAAYADIDLKKNQITLDNGLSIDLENSTSESTTGSSIKIMAMLQLAELDAIIAPEDVFEYYAESGTFVSLDTILSPELQEKYKDLLYTCDVTIEDVTTSQICGIDVTNTSIFTDAGGSSVKMMMGFVVNQPHLDQTLDFLDYIN